MGLEACFLKIKYFEKSMDRKEKKIQSKIKTVAGFANTCLRRWYQNRSHTGSHSETLSRKHNNNNNRNNEKKEDES